jgi:copper transport protein
VLLRTEPSPQTTVAHSPTAVRLVFSEPVEAVFGAVRLFDVDGTRVRTGEARHPEGTRSELSVPLPEVADGTYTVTWRVVSDDGHPVRGGFVFYVGSPSAISSVAIAGEESAGALVGWGGGAARFGWYLALAALVGAVVVRRWVWTPAAAAAGMPEAATSFRRGTARLLPGAWAVLAVTGAAGLLFQGAKVSGLSLADALSFDVLGEVVGTSFGRLWLVEMALTAVLAVPVAMLARRRMPPVLSPSAWMAAGAAIVAALVVTGALGGHARTDPNPALAAASVAVHLAAVSVWAGGLLVLVAMGLPAIHRLPSAQRPELLRQVLRRFSPLAVGGVAVVVVTGVLNSVLELSAFSDLWRLAYGRTVLAKVAALAVALALAARHLLVLPRRLQVAPVGEAEASPVRSFRTSSVAELAVLGVALALAAGLVDLVPGRTIALAAKGPVNQEHRVGASGQEYTVQLFIDPTQAGQNDVHVTFVDSSGLSASDIANTNVGLAAGEADPQPVRMRLLSPGHFVGEVDLPQPGPYRLAVRSPAPSGEIATTFTFRMSDELFKEKTS